MDPAVDVRNPVIALGALMLVGLGLIILLAGVTAQGNAVGVVLVGGALLAAGLVAFAASRGGGDAEEDDEEADAG